MMHVKRLLLSVLPIAVVLSAAAVPAQEARLISAQGTVRVLRGGDRAKSEPAAAGMVLEENDVIKTGADSHADIELGPGNVVRLEANSSMTISGPPRRPRLNLLGGRLLNRLKNIPKGGTVTIGTPTSIAGVAGTTFSVSVGGNGRDTCVDVLAGRVRVRSAGEPDKFAYVTGMHRVRLSNWKDTIFTATGSAVVSERFKRPTVRDQGKELRVVRATGMGSPAPTAETPDECTASARSAALDAARNELAERILRTEISEEKTVRDLALADKQVFEKVARLAADAPARTSRVLKDGRVEVEVEVLLADVNAAIGLETPVFKAAMVRITPEEYARIFTARGRLTTERAAQTVADRNLLETIKGVMIDSQTTVEDFAMKDDRATNRVQGIIRGAETVRMLFFSDGTVEVTRKVKGADVRLTIDSLMNRSALGVNYMGRPIHIAAPSYEMLRRFEQH